MNNFTKEKIYIVVGVGHPCNKKAQSFGLKQNFFKKLIFLLLFFEFLVSPDSASVHLGYVMYWAWGVSSKNPSLFVLSSCIITKHKPNMTGDVRDCSEVGVSWRLTLSGLNVPPTVFGKGNVMEWGSISFTEKLKVLALLELIC